ncbi:hypothetical protein COX00_02650 [Candidatus Uhrbacteria bacterium CG22_combo_CG10-13_8_21_14_all_47_17]|uniref:Uncharacterized protein n=1 Tax=Candidatus Uhrbacteria bacterium CG22_combo_CG10-13_8_21_14_all_47_17 TaxID=1975041 RepID=A0A2H0BS94_9BACT|nr:MAG: hypothetical protein COX00_02650 [Candidatus Uhrbacteria bacterium CG22_combo_CG10-13_8_21_14_all_47_17]
MQEKNEKEENIRLMVLERTYVLLTSAMSFVAALAWNDAIQSLFRQIFGTAASIYAKFFYAIIVTVVTVVSVWKINRFINRLKERMENKDAKKAH